MRHFTKILIFSLLVACQNKTDQNVEKFVTICNPLDLNYRFQLEPPSRREAADPTIILYKDTYYLFASKSGGYWYSNNLSEWNFIETGEIPTEEYAPTVVAIEDTMYFLASSNEKSTIYKTNDPLTGKWSVAKPELEIPVWDPAFFLDDDKRLYLYWGCSNVNPLYGIELDYKNNFIFIGKPKELIFPNPKQNGWEVPGDYNTRTEVSPWIEGAWLNKHNGRYYLQYAGPGTEFKSYADGVYTSDSPLGTYHLADNNPFSYKPEGFAAGAGHGSTFEDKYGNYWHIGTITISQKHMFERRLGLFPTFFDNEGELYTITKFGDYPIIIPDHKINSADEIFPGWLLLSFNKKVTVSSAIDTFPATNITDENIRTYWAATSGDSNEYAIIDLGATYDVFALQINFAEHNTTVFDRQKNIYHRYLIEYSSDNATWKILIDKSKKQTDNTHQYSQLTDKISCQYIKIKNLEVPDGNFALSGLRVFGKGQGAKPQPVEKLTCYRNGNDKRSIKLNWEKADQAIGYTINYGSDKNKLYHSYTIFSDTMLEIRSLNADARYYFSIDSFNENGVTPGNYIIESE